MADESQPGDEVEDLLFRGLERLEAGGIAALEEFLAQHPAQRRAVEQRLSQLRAAGLLQVDDREQLPERLGEFRLHERIGRGGMGVVYRATQEPLGREVALKVMPPGQLLFASARQRFRREVEAVARLQHPGIVQVHTVGEAEGVPYFAMEFLAGASLGEVLEALSGRAPEELTGLDLLAQVRRGVAGQPHAEEGGPLFRGNWFEVALRVVLEVALAVDHAHRRGVLHRDIKPSNVIVTAAGRVVLLDFGLASLAGADRLTRSGSYLGSVPYMAPEQLRGEAEAVGARADVYSSGVLLYELLTLSQPFLDPSSAERTRSRVLAGEAPPPRRLVRGLSRDLETVCLTAMDADPARRYRSAAELAEDLRNALELRPVTARRPGALLRLLRFAQRRPAATAAAGLGALLLTVVPTLFAVQESRRARDVGQLNLELSVALRDSEQQRAAAEANLETAFEAVDQMLARLGASTLADVPQMEALRQQLLRDALTFYERLMARAEAGADHRRAYRAVRLSLAQVHNRLGRFEAAEEVLGELVAELEARADTLDPGERHQLAHAYSHRSTSQRGRGAVAAARASSRAAVGELERVVAALRATGDGEVPAALEASLARERVGVGRFDLEFGEFEQGEQQLLLGIEGLRRQVELEPDDYDPLQRLGQALDYLSQCATAAGDLPRALELRTEAAALLERSHRLEPDAPEVTAQLVAALGNLGDQLGEMGRGPEGAPHVERAVELANQLVESYPLSPGFRRSLAFAEMALFFVEYERGDGAAARAALERARALGQFLTERFPELPEHWALVANAHFNLGVLLSREDELPSALEEVRAGRAALERALSVNPLQPEWRGGFWRSFDLEGAMRYEAGDYRGSAAVYLDQPEPPDPELRLRAASMLAYCAAALGRDDELRARAVAAALAHLDALQTAGQLPPGALDEDAEWSALLDRPEFEALRAASAAGN
jgi:serine/threonine protein kinase/tetratricopeptide (TPR) repeat protein